jgi:hypothetical protein
MSIGARGNGIEEETFKKLENSSKEEARQIILDLIQPECKSVASNFFTCIEDHTKEYDFQSGQSFEKIEVDLNEKYIPDCMNKFNLEECLNNSSPK